MLRDLRSQSIPLKLKSRFLFSYVVTVALKNLDENLLILDILPTIPDLPLKFDQLVVNALVHFSNFHRTKIIQLTALFCLPLLNQALLVASV
ncbi:hypothetical protein [uncultured Bradyrhizobium sp.]|jgi:hypothetical protein|uniref:hypothetical protein n=1 Tax=uncultured Bradyrhizobium sp. TaxID=199684 RepID=UPI002633B6B1|nr:hypothetical protein [uncultured Bradyrhizobium sp.]